MTIASQWLEISGFFIKWGYNGQESYLRESTE